MLMKGFSLLEIMVTVAIISIMAGSVVIGFNSFGQTVRLRETAGVITDTVKNLELEMIRREYKKQTVNFEPDYLVVEAEVENQTLPLIWEGLGGDCLPEEEWLKIDNSGSLSPVYLAQRDQYGNNIEIASIKAFTVGKACVAFKDSEETEWQYQVFRGSQGSQIIRFLHFNIRRDDSKDKPTIKPNKYTLEISAPYAAKEFFDDGDPPSGPVTLTIQNDESSEDITLQ